MENMIKGANGGRSIQILVAPLGEPEPRVVARLDEQYIVGGTQMVEGNFTVIAQVSTLIDEGETIPALRVLRETPPTPLEATTMTQALQSFIEPAAGLGVTISDDDITFGYPTVIVHPIAIFR
jgi:hypothetical protein